MEPAEDLISFGNCPPFVLKNQISDWPASKWTPQYLASQLTDNKYRCKIAPKDDDDVLWERECIHEEITLQEFIAWNDGNSEEDNTLNNYDRTNFSCYIDYKYMKDLFAERKEFLKEVDWSIFGLEGRDGSESTIWIGSDGCYTNCHYDTYGFNLVAQIYGRKRWILFPPSDTSNMYPTRIPYEESSVFSQINVKNPDLSIHSRFQFCHPHIIELNPGDVLFVPKHWWHYVECIDTAISINTWVEQDDDADSQVNEAITRMLFKCLIDMGLEVNTNSINPGEEVHNPSVNFSYLQEAFKKIHRDRPNCERPHSNLFKFASHVGRTFADSKILQNSETNKLQDHADVLVDNTLHMVDHEFTEVICQSAKRKNITDSSAACHKKKKIHDFDDLDSMFLKEGDNLKSMESELKDNIKIVKPVSFDTYKREIIGLDNVRRIVVEEGHDAECEEIRLTLTEKCPKCEEIRPTFTVKCPKCEETRPTSTVKCPKCEEISSTTVKYPKCEETRSMPTIKCQKCTINNSESESVTENKKTTNKDNVKYVGKKDISQDLYTSNVKVDSDYKLLTFNYFANCLLHPEVIEKIKEIMKR